jgi:asparagine synthase (glutamine-hydrolysing)
MASKRQGEDNALCGIAGYLGHFEAALLERMNQRIAHRGPDDAACYWLPEKHLGLAHRRLSIIDLSPLGRQPMWDVTGIVVIVFNGEIYNYQAIRNMLVAEGYRFRSHSDTEVLLNLYLRDGHDMLQQLNGIFAFALWDTRSDTLFLARDGLGVKPIYYAKTSKGFMFASELKALLQEPSLDRTLDLVALHSHLLYLWCPAPHTMLKAIQKLPPGYAMVVREGCIQQRWCFYDLPYTQEQSTCSVQEAIEQVRTHVRTAVERQMVADVPVGAFLSGGLDSSAVVTFAQQCTPAQKLQCFTIGFKEEAFYKEGMADDLPYAQRVAQHLGVDLHTIYVGPEMAQQLEKMIYHLDEPQADPAPMNVLFISQLARQHGIKVLLSGAGGDDIFTGYRRHAALEHEKYWAWLPQKARRGLERLSHGLSTAMPWGRRLAKALQYAAMEGDQRLVSYFYWINPQLLTGLYTDEVRAELAALAPVEPLQMSLTRLPVEVQAINRMLYLEGKHFLADHNLNYTDKMSMAAGVEVRVPLLDPDLITMAARLPTAYKQHGTVGKWIFKKAMEPYLPHDVIYRPKTGFGAPVRSWLRYELRPLVEELLSASALRHRGVFDHKAVQRLVEADSQGHIDGAYTIFALMCIELWSRIFLDRGLPQIYSEL